MKKLLQKFLFKNEPLAAFKVVRHNAEDNLERAVLHAGEVSVDVSDRHCIVCQVPFTLAIWTTAGVLPSTDNCVLLFYSQGKKACRLNLRFADTIHGDAQIIHLFLLKNTTSYQLSFFKRNILFAYFHRKNKNKISWKANVDFSVLYSFPRKVILTSFRSADHENIFPMDFQGFIQEDNIVLLGLRKTNITLARIQEHRQIAICSVTVDDTAHVYALGNRHSSEPLSREALPFDVYKSKTWDIFIPSFVKSYQEVAITRYDDLGSHILLVGKVIYQNQPEEKENLFHHLHLIQYLTRRS